MLRHCCALVFGFLLLLHHCWCRGSTNELFSAEAVDRSVSMTGLSLSLSFALDRRRLSRDELSADQRLREALSSPHEVPAVYIHFGKQLPAYLEYSVEMSATSNAVVILSDAFPKVWSSTGRARNESSSSHHLVLKRVFHVPLGHLSKNLSQFEQRYRPTRLNSPADSANRQRYELQCIERWLVLHAFAAEYNLSSLFYGDNDNVLFGNVSAVLARRKWTHHFANGSEDHEANRWRGGTCEAMVSVEGHMSEHDFLGTGELSRPPSSSNASCCLLTSRHPTPTYLPTFLAVAGHSSYWTQAALADLADFIVNIYFNEQYQELIALRREKLLQRRGGDRIVDMSLLYLWRSHCDPPTREKMAAVRAGDDNKFLKVKKKLLDTGMPVLYSDLRVCNGLDVQERAAFDHMHGYNLHNAGFTFNLNPEPLPPDSEDRDPREVGFERHYLPYFVGASLKMGGKPESLDEQDIARLKTQRLYLFNIHYQAGTKEFIKADVCRRLLSQATLLSVLHRRRHDQDFLDKFQRLYGSAENGNLTFLRDSIQNPTVREGCAGILSGMKSKWPLFDCVNHEQDINQKPICV
eukprot:gene35399-45862_t